MATLSSLSLNITNCGSSTSVPNDDIARLMYYLRCVTVSVGLDVLQDDLVSYKNYRSLSPTRIAMVVQAAAELSPDLFIDKVIFCDDDCEVVERNEGNKFVRISAACNILSLQSDIFIMGKVRNATEVMFFRSSWLDRNYTQPMQRIVRTLLGTPKPGEHQCDCDGCGRRSFTGVRYKCTTCYDYDLCEQCYKSNKHDMGHPFNRYRTPGARPTCLPTRARSKPSIPHTKTDTATNPPARYSKKPTTKSSSSPFFYDTMSVSELKHFLNDHGATFDDILDKETLCRRVWDTYCESMGITELNKFLAENSISTADCRDVQSRRQKAKGMFRPPKRRAAPPASANTSQVRGRKDDTVIPNGLNRAEMNGKMGTVMSVITSRIRCHR